MQFRPLNDLVLVKPDQAVSKVGSILLPEAAQTQSTTGTVVAVGPGKCMEAGVFVATSVKPGDRVMYAKFAGTELVIDEEQHYVMSEGGILGLIED